MLKGLVAVLWPKWKPTTGFSFRADYNNNNRLFMAPHLVRAQSTYKDIRIHSFHHSHTHTHARAHQDARTHTHTTNTCITGDGLVKRQISMQRRRDGFSVLTSEMQVGSCLRSRRSEFQMGHPMWEKELTEIGGREGDGQIGG